MKYAAILSAENMIIRLIFHCGVFIFALIFWALPRIKCMLLYRITIKIGNIEKIWRILEEIKKNIGRNGWKYPVSGI